LFGKRLKLQMGNIDRLKERNSNRTIAVATLQDDEIIGAELLKRFTNELIETSKETIRRAEKLRL
jgi:arsenite/tail-anchored protein-transporting ATPase